MSLREALRREFGSRVEVTLRASSGGVFDVRAGDTVVFSKFDSLRFPNSADLAGIKMRVRQMTGK